MADIGTRISTWLTGKLVGTDAFGNKYYVPRKAAKNYGKASMVKQRRWVIYKGINEASKVPAEWHSWLHHTVDVPPTEAKPQRYDWQREHLPNLTGTELAYSPLVARAASKPVDTYEAWSPDQ